MSDKKRKLSPEAYRKSIEESYEEKRNDTVSLRKVVKTGKLSANSDETFTIILHYIKKVEGLKHLVSTKSFGIEGLLPENMFSAKADKAASRIGFIAFGEQRFEQAVKWLMENEYPLDKRLEIDEYAASEQYTRMYRGTPVIHIDPSTDNISRGGTFDELHFTTSWSTASNYSDPDAPAGAVIISADVAVLEDGGRGSIMPASEYWASDFERMASVVQGHAEVGFWWVESDYGISFSGDNAVHDSALMHVGGGGYSMQWEAPTDKREAGWLSKDYSYANGVLLRALRSIYYTEPEPIKTNSRPSPKALNVVLGDPKTTNSERWDALTGWIDKLEQWSAETGEYIGLSKDELPDVREKKLEEWEKPVEILPFKPIQPEDDPTQRRVTEFFGDRGKLLEAKRKIRHEHGSDNVNFHIGRIDRRLYAMVHKIYDESVVTELRVLRKDEDDIYNFNKEVGYVQTIRQDHGVAWVEGVYIDDKNYTGLRLCTPMLSSHLERYEEVLGNETTSILVMLASQDPVQAENCYLHAAEQVGFYVGDVDVSGDMQIPESDAIKFGFLDELTVYKYTKTPKGGWPYDLSLEEWLQLPFEYKDGKMIENFRETITLR